MVIQLCHLYRVSMVVGLVCHDGTGPVELLCKHEPEK